MADGAELLPGALLGLAVRANSMQGAGGITAQIGNVCVTNVPGSQAPLYLRGYQMLAYYSLGPVYDNAGPIHLIVSYLGKIYLSVTSCREIVPDIERYVDCLQPVVGRAGRRHDRIAPLRPDAPGGRPGPPGEAGGHADGEGAGGDHAEGGGDA